MADKKSNDILEEQRRAREEFLKLKKMQQGELEAGPKPSEVAVAPKTAKEKAEQRALLQYFKPENRQIVLSALKKANRFDLIGTGRNCLVAPERNDKTIPQKKKKTIRNIHKKKK